jgi:hypothetical protein
MDSCRDLVVVVVHFDGPHDLCKILPLKVSTLQALKIYTVQLAHNDMKGTEYYVSL